MSQPVKLFISYARKDEAFKEELLVHLKPLKRNGIIEAWHDNDVELGGEWEPEILHQLETADVLLFLVSPNFMASDYIYDKEIVKAKERHDRKETIIVPIWIKPVGVPDDFLNRFQSLPKDRKPVSQWSDRDEAWADVVQRLNKLFEKLQNPAAIPLDNSASNASAGSNDLSTTIFTKTHIRDLISRGKTKDALQSMLTHTEGRDTELHNALTVLSSRFNELERSSRLGIVSNEESRLERNRVNMSLLSILDDVE